MSFTKCLSLLIHTGISRNISKIYCYKKAYAHCGKLVKSEKAEGRGEEYFARYKELSLKREGKNCFRFKIFFIYDLIPEVIVIYGN